MSRSLFFIAHFIVRREADHKVEFMKSRCKSFVNLDKKKLLGTGEFGNVYRGWITLKNDVGSGETQVEVAVKTCKRGDAMQGLLSEIKMLSYLGQHENIVGLIGANTSELANG